MIVYCRTRSKSKSGSSELPQNCLENHSNKTIDSSWRVDELAFLFFWTSKDHVQCLIMHACRWNGNDMAGMNGATASERGGTEWKHHCLTATVVSRVNEEKRVSNVLYVSHNMFLESHVPRIKSWPMKALACNGHGLECKLMRARLNWNC